MYNVLWIDDEWRKQDMFIRLCEKKYGVKITPFEFVHDGLAELEAHQLNWDAVILDAKVKRSEDDTPKLTGLQDAIIKIKELDRKHPLPYFISTGQPDLKDDDNFRDIYGKFYVKETDDDRLMRDVIAKIEELATDEFRLRNKYPDVFEAAKLIPDAEDLLFEGLRFELSDNGSEEFLANFNAVRKICENVVYKCQRDGYIPYINSLNAVPDFLNFREIDGFKLLAQIMHPALVQSLRYVLSITQDGSHERQDLNLYVMDYVRGRHNNNLYKSVLYIVMDLMLWYRELLQDFPDTDGLWTGKYLAEGPVRVMFNRGRTMYVVNGKYSLEDNGELDAGVEVVILRSSFNSSAFGSVTEYVRKNNYRIKR